MLLMPVGETPTDRKMSLGASSDRKTERLSSESETLFYSVIRRALRNSTDRRSVGKAPTDRLIRKLSLRGAKQS